MNVVIYYQRRFRTEVQREEGEREEEEQQVNVRGIRSWSESSSSANYAHNDLRADEGLCFGNDHVKCRSEAGFAHAVRAASETENDGFVDLFPETESRTTRHPLHYCSLAFQAKSSSELF